MSRLQPLGSLSLPKAPNTSERGTGDRSGACKRSCCWTPTGHSTVRDPFPAWHKQSCKCHPVPASVVDPLQREIDELYGRKSSKET